MHIYSFCANNVLKKYFFPSLQENAMTLETAAHSAAPPQMVCMWTPLAPPTCPVTARS